MKSLEKLVQELMELRRMKDDLDGMISAVTGEITTTMELEGVDEATTSTARVTWRPVTSSRFDKAAFLREHSDEDYKRYCKTYHSRRFTISA